MVEHGTTKKSLRAKAKWVTVNDKMQKQYRYQLTAPMGRNFDAEFKPQLTPAEMLELGVYCGKYMTDCRKEFPRAGSSGQSCRRKAATARSTILALTPAGHYRSGARTVGSTPTTRAAGSSGTAATTRAGGCQRKTSGR
jgi:hypothetical protein